MKTLRRGTSFAVVLWVLSGCGWPAAAAPVVASVGMTVSDLDRSVQLFTRVLGFEKVSESEISGDGFEHFEGVFGARARVAELKLGSEHVVLSEYLAPRGRPIPPDARSNDRSFQHIAIVVSDMAEAYRRVLAAGLHSVSTSPQRLPDWNPNAGGIEAFYFQDADGHNLELIWYPPGKGDPRWQERAGRLFLGIDHTAIGVADTEASLAFYRDFLGLRVAGASENWGPEQEHLNQVFGARLRITGLRGEGGPGIELLEYLTPSTGRPGPFDLAANDLLHWQTTLSGVDLDAAWKGFPRSGRRVSPGPVALGSTDLGFSRGLLVRDPDGHGLALMAP